MKIIDLLLEKRSNPHLNPRISNEQRMESLARKDPSLWVTFLDYPKVGMNPMGVNYSRTPLGYYSYPIGYVVERMKRSGTLVGSVPWNGRQKYAIAYNIRGNIVDVTNFKASSKVANILHDFVERNVSTPSEKERLAEDIDFKIDRMGIMQMVSNIAYVMRNEGKGKQQNIMTRILRDYLGWDGAQDHGAGNIHENEPHQAVVFDRRNIKTVEIFQLHNKEVKKDYEE